MEKIRYYEHDDASMLVCMDAGDRQQHNYLVPADSPKEAIDKLRSEGVVVDGADTSSTHDCSGQWFCANVTESDCEYNELLGLYIVPVYWRMDV
ncbi:hypothetical protein [Vibrio owensii]|uniref:hypothetical protein n=1 Tax=Vibrio owensii TaxID=696485 RepID=UPI0018F21B03|nr:hypothetical protein [Vibrio owensii]